MTQNITFRQVANAGGHSSKVLSQYVFLVKEWLILFYSGAHVMKTTKFTWEVGLLNNERERFIFFAEYGQLSYVKLFSFN